MRRRQRKRVSEKQGPISTVSFLTFLSPLFSFLSLRSLILPQGPEQVARGIPQIPLSGLHQTEMAPCSGTEQTSPWDCETHPRAFASRSCPQTTLQRVVPSTPARAVLLFFVLQYLCKRPCWVFIAFLQAFIVAGSGGYAWLLSTGSRAQAQ